jgi:hypothetical protein
MKCQRSVHLEQANRVRDALFFESLRAPLPGSDCENLDARKNSAYILRLRTDAGCGLVRHGTDSLRRQVAPKFSDARRGQA